jgi:NAD(P)-dependent dehydrogenase (short-subunit alcohol dehydrogenase family)
MTLHPALSAGRVAVITGAASGIGLAAAKRFAAMGMKIVMADRNADGLALAVKDVVATTNAGTASIRTVSCDVSRLEDVQRLKDEAYAAFGEVAVLMNNAGIGHGGGPYEKLDRWQAVLGVNLWGVIHGVQVFTPAMLAQQTMGAIINTGSKQGITTPPGDTAYNVSKAGVKVLTEGLAHALRNEPGGRITAHLLVPGFTHTGINEPVRAEKPPGAQRPSFDSAAKPPGAWTAAQVVDMLVERMSAGDFYIICPDNEVTSDLDKKRIRWAADDIVQNRPPLSRWHPDYKAAFDAFVKQG